jgi:Leucine rich repeat
VSVCKWENKTLNCHSTKQGPVIDWSGNQNQFDWSDIHNLTLKRAGIKSFKNEFFTKFTNVETIDLRSNELRVIDFNQFGNNSQLTQLRVGFNQITEIIPIINSTCNNITDLRINDNDLTDILGLCKLAKLKNLDLSGNRRIDFSKTKFSCWSELTHLLLAETNLKNLNHDYRMLTGCNKLEYLKLKNNDLELLCFAQFPVLPELKFLNIGNNSLISLDVVELRRKFKGLIKITTTGNKWTCDYQRQILTIALEALKIKETPNNASAAENECLQYSVDPKMRICPRIVKNETFDKRSVLNQIMEKIMLEFSFWAVISIDFLFVTFEIWYLIINVYSNDD